MGALTFDWLITTSLPATLIAAARGNAWVFAAICNVTVPLWVPPLPAVTVTQFSEFWTVHEHPELVSTLTVAVPPSFEMLIPAGVTLNVHGAAPCETVTVRPAIVSVPVRGVVVGLDSTVKPNQVVPVPELPFGMVTQGTLLEADQLQPAVVLTSALLAEPAPPIVTVAGVTL